MTNIKTTEVAFGLTVDWNDSDSRINLCANSSYRFAR